MKGSFFNGNSTDRNDERICKKSEFHIKDEVMTAMKDMFKDILQKVMECELADELGYEKSERTSNDECGKKSKNYRNGYSKKTVKTQMGELEIKVPQTHP